MLPPHVSLLLHASPVLEPPSLSLVPIVLPSAFMLNVSVAHFAAAAA